MVHIFLNLSISKEILSNLELVLFVHPILDRRIVITVNEDFNRVADLEIMNIIRLTILDVHLESPWNILRQLKRERQYVLPRRDALAETESFAAALHKHNLTVEFIQLLKGSLFLLLIVRVIFVIIYLFSFVAQTLLLLLIHQEDLVLVQPELGLILESDGLSHVYHRALILVQERLSYGLVIIVH